MALPGHGGGEHELARCERLVVGSVADCVKLLTGSDAEAGSEDKPWVAGGGVVFVPNWETPVAL